MKKSEHDHVLWRRLRLLLPVGVVSAATVLGVSLAGAQQTVQKGPPPATAAQIAALKSAALTFAQENGDANPIRGELVSGTRASVVPLLMNGAEANTDPNVYVIELEGTFGRSDCQGGRLHRNRCLVRMMLGSPQLIGLEPLVFT